MPEKSTLQEILFTAFLAVGVKIAIEMKRTKSKISILSIVLSMIIGVGTAYLTSGLVIKHFSNEWLAIVIAVVAILSEKIGEFCSIPESEGGHPTISTDQSIIICV